MIQGRVPIAGARVLLATLLTGIVFPLGLQAQGETHAIIVVGLGGSAQYRERFHNHAAALKAALTERHGIPAENVIYLGERPEDAPDVIADKSTRANLFRVLARWVRAPSLWIACSWF